jgi:hypothetical protein
MLTKLHHTSIVGEFITSLEQLTIRTKGFTRAFFKAYLTNGLQEDIKTQVEM